MSKWIAEFELEDGDTMPEHMDLEYKGGRIDFHCRPLEQEPRKGQWIPYLKEGLIVKCSNCESRFTLGYNFCPNCGADMRGEEE